ncbi:MAG: 50S ribosomal protein L20 [bacterium]|nr:50S ribosomal protein L20 [bacterium]
MSRVKSSVASRQRRKKVLKMAEGYYGRKSKLYKTAKETVQRALRFAYRDRKVNKRYFRGLWITRINALLHKHDLSYSKFISAMKNANIILNRKMLAFLAFEEPEAFEKIIEEVKKATGVK